MARDLSRSAVDPSRFNLNWLFPFGLRFQDFQLAMQDVYDFLFDINEGLASRGLRRFEDMTRSQTLSGLISDMLAASLAKHSRVLTLNEHHNGHPDLIVDGMYANNSVQTGEMKYGVEIKSTIKKGGAVDTHGARDQWLCVFVYSVDRATQPERSRVSTRFTEVYLAQVDRNDFRRNQRGELGTRTATLNREGLQKLRQHWVYLDQ